MIRVRLRLTLLGLFVLLPASAAAGVQQRQFEQVLDHLQALYAPEFMRQQQRLRITGWWESERLEASARTEEDLNGHLAVITITGGLARHSAFTEGALAMVVCHEIGHFLGGLPAAGRYSTEGQADYFAAAACMRRLLLDTPFGTMADSPRAPPIVKQRCASAYSNRRDAEACIYTTMSGYALSSYFAVSKSAEVPGFDTPDTNEVKSLSFGTPTVQCRLDTYIAAALCNPEAKDATFSSRRWLCMHDGGLADMARPRCWYPEEEKASPNLLHYHQIFYTPESKTTFVGKL